MNKRFSATTATPLHIVSTTCEFHKLVHGRKILFFFPTSLIETGQQMQFAATVCCHRCQMLQSMFCIMNQLRGVVLLCIEGSTQDKSVIVVINIWKFIYTWFISLYRLKLLGATFYFVTAGNWGCLRFPVRKGGMEGLCPIFQKRGGARAPLHSP